LPIHYFARVDFNGFKKAVDALGGVDISVEKDLYDNQYPDERNPKRSTTFSIKAGRHHMNGATALRYVRCRKGTCGGDFGRAARQQQVLLALREKALSLQTLTNPSRISALIDVVGGSAKTDLQLAEIRKLAEIAQQIDPNKVTTKVLDTSPGGLLMFGNVPGAGSIEIPRAGIGNFSEIQQFVHSLFTDSYLKEEKAKIEIQDASGKGLGAALAKQLLAYNYNVVNTLKAPKTKPSTLIYDYSKGKKPYTLRYLEQRFRLQAQRLPRATGNEADIVIIIGTDYKFGYTSQ
jgi:anionic cell wall polymer biosynthesis LytR-Cps2A-Psr (LCP) family protein